MSKNNETKLTKVANEMLRKKEAYERIPEVKEAILPSDQLYWELLLIENGLEVID